MASEANERPTVVRVTENSFYALVRAFKDSPKFKAFADETRQLWGRELDFACRPKCLGTVALDVIRPALVQEYLDGWNDKPGKQAAALSALKALEKWAVVRDLLPRSITLGVETGRPQGGHMPWTDEQVALAEKHARPDIARAVTLGANTGQRRSDLIRMGPTDIEIFEGREGIRVVQVKTGREVWVPILSALSVAIETWPYRPGPYLRRPDDKPWGGDELTAAWTYERDHNRELEPLMRAGLVLHGLRGHACIRLYRAGATTRQVADMVGMSEGMVARYTKKSVQRENATAAVIHLEKAIDERKRREGQ